MGKMTKGDAQNKFILYYGNRYAGIDGVSVWQLSGWELIESGDSNDLIFIIRDMMSGNPQKIEFTKFREDYTNIGTDPNPPKQSDGVYTSKQDDLDRRLNLMTDEEEAEFNRRNNTGGNSNQINNNSTTPEHKQPDKYTNPIHILLDGRKNKPTVKIPVEYEMEFIDDFFYKLIEQSYNDSLDSVIDYFVDSVNLEDIKKVFKDSIEIYIIEKLASDESIILSKKEDIENRNKGNGDVGGINNNDNNTHIPTPTQEKEIDVKQPIKNKLTVVSKK